jgi:hypothetical protein
MKKPQRLIQPLLFAGMLAVGLMSFRAADPVRHPCHPGSPGGPGTGPPCPPTPTPAAAAAEADGTAGSKGPVRFEVSNETAETVTIWLGDPAQYVFSVGPESVKTFVVDRDVYIYELASCQARSSGYLNLTIHSFILVDPCATGKLVRVQLVNESDHYLAVMLSGPEDYIIPVGPGESRSLTIKRGEYFAEITGCVNPYEMSFRAQAGSTVVLQCP